MITVQSPSSEGLFIYYALINKLHGSTPAESNAYATGPCSRLFHAYVNFDNFGGVMFIIPVNTAEDGSISASDPAPVNALCTITTPDGCQVYMPGDEEALAARLAEQEQEEEQQQ